MEKRGLNGAGFDPPEKHQEFCLVFFFKLRSRKDSPRYIAERRSA